MTKNTRNSLMLQATASYIDKIETFANDSNINFSEYQKSCVANAVRTINPLIVKGGYSWQSFSVDNIITVLQQTAFLEVNPSAIPSECYYIIRKEKQKDNSWLPILEFNIEGSGNDKILLTFGQDVSELKSYIVYDEDEFTEGFLDGWDMTLPKYKRTFITNKPMKVVYLIKKTTGEIDVQYADISDVMKSLLANAKQNLMNAKDVNENKLLREMAKLGLYEVLEDEKWLDYELTKAGYNNSTYKAPLINPSYTSPISMYSMIERKLRNHATRKYPKNFNHKEVSVLYEDTFNDEKYNAKGEIITAEERVEIAAKEVEEKTATKQVFEKEVVVETVIKKVEDDDRPALVVEKEPLTENNDENNITIEQEEPETEKEIQQSLDNTDDEIPEWMKP